MSRLFKPCTLVSRITARARSLHGTSSLYDLHANYADKLQRRADEEGKTLDELKASIKAQRRPEPVTPAAAKLVSQQRSAAVSAKHPPHTGARKDSSPVKPLAEFMDLNKLLQTPHTAAQVSALWTAYHATRNGGTGRGYLSATIPLSTYTSLTQAAEKYPTFVLPLPRDVPAENGDAERAYEFHFLEWAFHDAPPHPSAHQADFPFSLPMPAASPPGPDLRNPAVTTVLFTPLQEYKLRQSFATPHLVLTHYTDLAHTHGIVLLRGELTASPSGAAGRFLLGQHDAQLLALAVQRFYLAGADGAEAQLLRAFHESPGDFQWEELLKHADPTSIS